MNDIEKAQDFLRQIFPGTEKATQYIAAYTTARGRNIALERNRQGQFYVWTETNGHDLDGIVVNNRKVPGMPYAKEQSRNSNLNDKNTPRLKVGNQVWYLVIRDYTTFQQFVRWYASA